MKIEPYLRIMYDFIFIVFAIITVGSSLFVAFAKSIAHAAFALVATLFGVAGLFVMLGADFVGVSQLLVYVGGILILFLFGSIGILWVNVFYFGKLMYEDTFIYRMVSFLFFFSFLFIYF